MTYAITYRAHSPNWGTLPVTLSALDSQGLAETLDYLQSPAITDWYTISDIQITSY